MFSEFYCNASTGSNLNAGSTTGAASVTSTNGDWDNAASNRFTAASGTPFSGVSAGEFASVYLDGASAPTGFVGRITAVNGGGASVDISATAKSGTKPAAGASGRTCVVGGVWKGPNAAVGFPFNFIATAMTNATGNPYRVNLKNGTTYSITAAVTHTLTGPGVFRGYTTTVGDGGRFVIDGGTSGASYILLTITGVGIVLRDAELQNNGATGNNHGLVVAGTAIIVRRVVVNSVRGCGIDAQNGVDLTQCETYSCNQANGAFGGIRHAGNTACSVDRCISHHNTGSNSSGFVHSSTWPGIVYRNCIAHANGQHGWSLTTGYTARLRNCDAYANTGSGVLVASSAANSTVLLENCNLVANGAYGVGITSSNVVLIENCGFGSGTKANTSGAVQSAVGAQEIGSVTYTANTTPWADPDDGDFTITSAQAKAAGNGSFLQTQSGYGDPNPTVSYPDIGAAQHLETDGGTIIKGRASNIFAGAFIR